MVAKAPSHEDGILGAHYDELLIFHVVSQDEILRMLSTRWHFSSHLRLCDRDAGGVPCAGVEIEMRCLW